MEKHYGMRYPCEHCEYIALLRRKMIIHTQAFHSDGKYKVKCNICDKEFPHKDYLRNHKVRQHGKKSVTVKCPQCPAMIKGLIKNCEKIYHDKKFLEIIAFILQKFLIFLKASGLTRHIRRIHENDPSFIRKKLKCDLCESFISK